MSLNFTNNVVYQLVGPRLKVHIYINSKLRNATIRNEKLRYTMLRLKCSVCELYVVRCGSKNGYQKDMCVLKRLNNV